MKAMSTSFNESPEEASRPFEARRDGFVMGGAGVLILENLNMLNLEVLKSIAK